MKYSFLILSVVLLLPDLLFLLQYSTMMTDIMAYIQYCQSDEVFWLSMKYCVSSILSIIGIIIDEVLRESIDNVDWLIFSVILCQWWWCIQYSDSILLGSYYYYDIDDTVLYWLLHSTVLLLKIEKRYCGIIIIDIVCDIGNDIIIIIIG